MGYDISHHPIDTHLLCERLLPWVMGNDPLEPALGDYLDRAAALNVVGHRANQWGLRVVGLDLAIHDRQRERAPRRMERRIKRTAPPARSLLARLLGRPAPAAPVEYEEVEAWAKTTGLPGFDSDLSVWGRPFFVLGEDTRTALAELDEYLACTPDRLDAVDALAMRMLQRLETMPVNDPDLLPEVRAALDEFRPFAAHLPENTDHDDVLPEPSAVRAHLARKLQLARRVWTHRKDREPLDDPLLDEPTLAADCLPSVPFHLVDLAAQVLPGWMGRGRVWSTALFDRIGVDVSRVFGTAEPLFAPMVRAHPALARDFHDTIIANYMLGGYVPPKQVPTLVELLERHREPLTLAAAGCERASDLMPGMDADYRKLREAAEYAKRHGHGFLEAAEVYSGFLGIMN